MGLKMSLNLIEKAIEYAKEERLRLLSRNFGIYEPLTPKAVHSHRYLLVKEYLNVGARKASKLVLNPYMRPPAYSILVKALNMIFTYGKKPEIIEYYNKMLDEIIGTH